MALGYWQKVAEGTLDRWQDVVSGAQQFFAHGDQARFEIYFPSWAPQFALDAIAGALNTVLGSSGIALLSSVHAEGTTLVFEVRENSPVILGIALAPIPAAILQATIAIGLVALAAIVLSLTFAVLKWTAFSFGLISGVEGSADWLVIGGLLVLGLMLIRK